MRCTVFQSCPVAFIDSGLAWQDSSSRPIVFRTSRNWHPVNLGSSPKCLLSEPFLTAGFFESCASKSWRVQDNQATQPQLSISSFFSLCLCPMPCLSCQTCLSTSIINCNSSSSNNQNIPRPSYSIHPQQGVVQGHHESTSTYVEGPVWTRNTRTD